MLENIGFEILRIKPGGEAFQVSCILSRRERDEKFANFNRFSGVETRSCYSCLVLHLHVNIES